MLFLKLSLLTLLTVAPGLLVYAETNVSCGSDDAAHKCETTVACEGEDAILTCGAGVLNIVGANYGRADSTTCSDGRPSNELNKTDCCAPYTLAIVTNMCKGKKSCVVPATNSVFSDPCFGTYKYLSIKYSCTVHKASVTCEGGDAVLHCGTGVLAIHCVNYGRTDSITCSAGRPRNQITKTDCYSTNALSDVRQMCEGKSSCVVHATNSVFSDPCFGTYKYLSIKYSCKVIGGGCFHGLVCKPPARPPLFHRGLNHLRTCEPCAGLVVGTCGLI